MSKITITELQGDGIGPEVAESLHAVAESLPLEFDFRQIDWSLETRERLGEEAIDVLPKPAALMQPFVGVVTSA